MHSYRPTPRLAGTHLVLFLVGVVLAGTGCPNHGNRPDGQPTDATLDQVLFEEIQDSVGLSFVHDTGAGQLVLPRDHGPGRGVSGL